MKTIKEILSRNTKQIITLQLKCYISTNDLSEGQIEMLENEFKEILK